MTNAFDSANYPTTEPTQLVAGDRWAWKRKDLNADYVNSAYTLKYALRLQGAGATEIAITATASGLEYIVKVAQLSNRQLYRWSIYLSGVYHAQR